jgi:hypothetical protein
MSKEKNRYEEKEIFLCGLFSKHIWKTNIPKKFSSFLPLKQFWKLGLPNIFFFFLILKNSFQKLIFFW